MHYWDDGSSWGSGNWAMMAMMLLFAVLAVGTIVWVVRQSARPHHHLPTPCPATDDRAARILDERFARGEIDEDDYTSRRKLLATPTPL